MAGLIGGAMRAASGRVRDEERKRPTRPAPIVQGTQARTRDQAQMGGLIGGTYSSPKSRGFWDEIMADPFTALLAGRNGLDRKYEAQAAEDEARRMAPQMQWMEQFTQGLPDQQRFAAMTAPGDLGKEFAKSAAPKDLINVSPDGALVDPVTRAPVFTNRKPDTFTLGPDQVRYSGSEEVARGPKGTSRSGINLTFGEDGGLAGLSIGGPQMPLGGDGPKGKGPAVIAGPGGEVRVSPGQQQLVQNKDWQRIQSAEAQSNLVREDIRKAMSLVGPNTTGALAATKDLPFFGASTDSGRLANALATIKANVGFDNLQNMRENSPTGGALGAVTEKEIAFLQAMQGSLEQAQTPADLAANLKRLDEFFAGREQRRREAFAQDYPELAEFAGFAKRTSNEVKRLSKDINKAVQEYNALKKGDRYIDDDGIERTKQ